MLGTGSHEADENKAQQILYAAIAAFRSSLQDAGALSSVRHDALAEALGGWDDYVKTYIPDAKHWSECTRRSADKETYDRRAFRGDA